ALLAAFLAAFNHALEKKERRAQAVAALAFGALMLTHAFSAYVALMLCVLLVGMRLVRGNTRWPELVWVCGILVAGFLASAFWWAPAFFSFDGRGYILGWLTPTLHGLISGILSGDLVGSLAVSLLGVAGLGLAVVRRKTEDLFLALAAVLLLWLSMGQASFLPLLDAAMSAQSVRFLGPFVLVWAFLAALTVDVFVRAGVNWNRGPWKRFTPFFIASVMIAVLAVAVPPVFDVANAHIRTGSDFSALADVDAAMQWIAANTPSSARFVTEYHEVVQGVYGTPYGSPHVLSQFLPLYANRASVTGNFPEGSPSSFGSVLFSAYLAERPESVRSDFIRYGVSHALAYAPQTVQRLRATFGYELVFEQGAVAVFRLTDAPVHPFRAPAGASVLSFEESPTEWRSRMASEQGAMVNVAVTFHPNWRAYVDGTPVALEKSGDNLMRFFLPAGAHAVRLVYVPPGYSAPLLAFGLLVFTALVSVAFGRKTQDTA
ncbi:MAG: 6-pyruvoyl-tetrahydropterin synthase-related protein, partial [Candidatus Micrarchaeota archaeon]|nr:6-pyruvoyl-tetrahydropterin synthase-related protein [Candidatus Micrarchaeota archaeon]